MSKAAKSIGALKRSPIHLLHRALQLAVDVYAQEAGPDAVSQRQFVVLSALDAADGVSQSELVRLTGIDRSTLAELVARMTAQGLVARERSAADARSNVVRLTAAGREVFAAVAPRAAAADKRLLKLLPSKKRDGFVRQLQELAGHSLVPPTDPTASDRRKRDGEPGPDPHVQD